MSMSQGDTNLQQQYQQLHALQQRQLQDQQQRQLQDQQQQFQQLQDQQRPFRLQLSTDPQPSLANQSSFRLDENLNFGRESGLCSQNCSDFLSEERAQHLNNQIRELKDETGRLYKCLSEKDYEIRHLNKKRDEDRLSSQSQTQLPSNCNKAAATKIVDLSKQVEELKAAYESEKAKGRQQIIKASQLEKEMSLLKSQGSLGLMGGGGAFRDDALTAGCVLESDFKSVCDRLRFAENRAAELNMQQMANKEQVQKLTKALSQEVGDGYSLQSILSNTSTWRGRQQQILLLQKKLNDMRSELNNYKISSSPRSMDVITSLSLASVANRRNDDDQVNEVIRKQEMERKESMDKCAAELKALEGDNEMLKKKFEGSKAKNKVLKAELKSVKQQVNLMQEKGKNDDDLIKALKEQLETVKKLADDAAELHEEAIQELESQVKELSMRNEQSAELTEHVKLTLAEKEEKLHQIQVEWVKMNEENLELSQKVTQLLADLETKRRSRTKSKTVDNTHDKKQKSDSELSSDELDARVIEDFHSDAEPSNLDEDLVHLFDRRENTDFRHRTSKAGGDDKRLRESAGGSRKKPRSLRSRHTNHKNSVKASDEQREVRSSPRQESAVMTVDTLGRATELERDRLHQLVHNMQHRITQMTLQVSDLSHELQNQKRRNVTLEKQTKIPESQALLKSSSPSRPSTSRLLNNVSQYALQNNAEVLFDENDLVRDTENDLPIALLDENQALKSALQSTLLAKEEDLRLYQETISQTRKVFLHGILDYKKDS